MSGKILMTASVFGHIRSFHLPYITRLRSLGYEVHIACGGATTDIPSADRCISLPLKKRMLSPSNPLAALRLRKLIRQEGYALVITHTSLAAFFTRLALLGLKDRPRTVNVVHGYLFDADTSLLKRKLLEAAELLLAGVTDRLLVMNRSDLLWAQAHHAAARIDLIPGMGVDPARFAAADGEGASAAADGTLTLLCLAEFSKRKNQAMLIRAMTRLPDRVRLILAGDGALRERCMQLAVRLGVDDRVLFPGHVDDAEKWLHKADAAVSASRSEGLPFHVMEAMFCAKPVIASNVKGNSDLLQDGENGFLYPYGDEARFAAAAEALLNAPARRKEMGQRGRQLAKKYALSEVLPVVTAAYLGK